MIRIGIAIGLAASFAASVEVQADLYRYRDPQTGQIKFTNVAPPWLKNRAAAAHAPKVEVIREPPPSTAGPREQNETPAPHEATKPPAGVPDGQTAPRQPGS